MNVFSKLRRKHRKILDKAGKAGTERDYATAEALYRKYLETVPDDPLVLFNMGCIKQAQSKDEKDLQRMYALCAESMDFYHRCILSPEIENKTKADALNNSGLVMGKVGEPEKAKISFHLAKQLNPLHRAARQNYADVQVFEGDFEGADREFFEVINLDPSSAGAQFSRSMILLLMGDLRRGFMEYRARFGVGSFQTQWIETEKPLWEGQSLDGQTLLIWQEQGWGDSIQFIRYAEGIKLIWPNSRIVFCGGDYMHSLMRSVKGVDNCVESAKGAAFDYHIPMLHLPDVFRTSLETVPANIPYITPQAHWIPFDVPPSDKPKVALCWAGNALHGKDKWRSMAPEQFQRFIDAAPHCQFYSLQCGPRAHEAEEMRNIIGLAPTICDWTQTANALLQMDLLITVDTAVAHLAGALGKPVWILLANSPDWRWMLTRTSSPWYPKARLFRQPQKDDWETPINEVMGAIEDFACQHAAIA